MSSAQYKCYSITIIEKCAGWHFNAGIKVAARVGRGRVNRWGVNVKWLQYSIRQFRAPSSEAWHPRAWQGQSLIIRLWHFITGEELLHTKHFHRHYNVEKYGPSITNLSKVGGWVNEEMGEGVREEAQWWMILEILSWKEMRTTYYWTNIWTVCAQLHFCVQGHVRMCCT